MRTQITVTDSAEQTACDVVVEAPPETPMPSVLASISAGTGIPMPEASPPGNGSEGHGTWSESGIRDGSVLRLDALAENSPPDSSAPSEPDPDQVQIRVVGGFGTGKIFVVSQGKASIGSDAQCIIQVNDDGIPLVAAVIDITAEAQDAKVTGQSDKDKTVQVERAHEGVLLTLDGEPVKGRITWKPGGVLRVGNTLYELTTGPMPKAALKDSDESGKLDFNRPPRFFPPPRQTKFKLPSIPTEEQQRSLPIAMMLAPLVLSCGIAILMQRPAFLLFGLLSPVMLLANYYSSKKSGKLGFRERMRIYRTDKKGIEGDAKDVLTAFEQEQRLLSPDPATVAMIATTPSPRLWERRRTDPDHLAIRLGVSSAPSDVVLEDPEQLEHKRQVTWDAHDIPVVVPLAQRGVIGLCGPDGQVRNLAGWIVAQLGVRQSPRDIQIYLFTSADARAEWEWVRWLPHTRPDSARKAISLVGTDSTSVGQRVSELSQIIAERMRLRGNSSSTAEFAEPDIVVVLDGARKLRAWPGIAQLLIDGPAVGVYAVCLDAEERLLPEECNAVFAPGSAGLWALRQQREHDIDEVLPDQVPASWFEWVARALAPIRDAGDDADAVLPASARLLEVTEMEPPSAEAVRLGWARSGRSTEAIIGVNLDGPFAIDICRDGPHALVGGTTGSGKSELLQTLVASLARVNRPDALTFVLVDYKGAAAFKDCVDLPHTVGMVTDLDTHLVERAMDSLSAELRRREHLLADAGAKDIEDYTILADRDSSIPAMPRLMIVIDEFAAMKAELPDFVTGIVNIAQRGRSLGIHLVLATQRPSGVISADIRANTNLRIALRVNDPADSQDILAAADASKISQDYPGRGYVRSGTAALMPFQAARVGGRRPGARSAELPDPKVIPVPWAALGAPIEVGSEQSQGQEEEVTDLVVLVRSIREAAEQLNLPVQHSPWLPALPLSLTLNDLPGSSSETTGSQEWASSSAIPPIPFGLEDLPKNQEQRAKSIDMQSFSHLYICGSARSGRSQTLRTIAGSIARSVSVNDVHIYGLDFGNGALLPIEKLPHCGAVVTRLQADRVDRLLTRITTELHRWQQILAVSGYANITEQRQFADEASRLPHLVVLFDQWEGFLSSLGEAGSGPLAEKVMNLLREGAPAGIHFIIAGDKQLLNSRMSSLVEDKLILRFSDRNDYSMAGLQPRSMPDAIPDGRAFAADRGIETQIALLDQDPSGQAQAEALKTIAEDVRATLAVTPAVHRPFTLGALPTSLSFEEAWSERESTDSRLWALLGVGGDELTALGASLGDGTPSFLIAGPPRSGKSTMVRAMAESLLRQAVELVILAPRRSPVSGLAGRAGVKAVLNAAELSAERLEQHLPAGTGNTVLVIDDAELIQDDRVRGWFKEYLRTCSNAGSGLIAAANIDDFGRSIFSGWEVDLKNNRNGALLAPSSMMHGAMIGASLTKNTLAQVSTAGRALVRLDDGELHLVQVPFG
ncbi:FtsK/SpoIIIE domain-containing protein [Acaricomes phytoseiuli]|uniref:FtsK/SpoIIIE domain-containing protein n=1 Tax=Acaricomes phytoseiuli TaxID=291968 RepID=UPI002222FC76|nr:FtsK/SpoIIIE domain-containing protein [Acaricomes phytoseiuli]MCW1249348.1 FtsK/SpoIIIE domain-containing protein [Acaricomes phytoseiuli]